VGSQREEEQAARTPSRPFTNASHRIAICIKKKEKKIVVVPSMNMNHRSSKAKDDCNQVRLHQTKPNQARQLAWQPPA
jgi:hypothetical protein